MTASGRRGRLTAGRGGAGLRGSWPAGHAAPTSQCGQRRCACGPPCGASNEPYGSTPRNADAETSPDDGDAPAERSSHHGRCTRAAERAAAQDHRDPQATPSRQNPNRPSPNRQNPNRQNPHRQNPSHRSPSHRSPSRQTPSRQSPSRQSPSRRSLGSWGSSPWRARQRNFDRWSFGRWSRCRRRLRRLRPSRLGANCLRPSRRCLGRRISSPLCPNRPRPSYQDPSRQGPNCRSRVRRARQEHRGLRVSRA